MTDPFDQIDIRAAAERIGDAVRRTPLEPWNCGDDRIELRLKLECLQETGSFKVRGSCNQIRQLSAEERDRGVIATSSGNHGQALAWAARNAGVHATIVMPKDAYPNKIEACRSFEAEVVLADDRMHAEVLCAERVAGGAVLVHPYDAERTVQGAGTVGLEIADQWPEVEIVVFPIGGGGLIAGSSIALSRALEGRARVFGCEPTGAATMQMALERGEPVELARVTSAVQGLCPPSAGRLNTRVCQSYVDRVFTLSDEDIYAAQAELVLRGGWTVEPAGACSTALITSGHFPTELLESRSSADPLRVVAVVSGGNPAPEQLAELRRAGARSSS